MESANQTTPQTQSDNSALHNRDLQCLVILKRLKSLKYTLDVLSNESRKDILNANPNLRAKFPVTSFWSCHAHATCVECDICCSCVLKMYVEIHMLSERDYVGDNYVAVSNILNTLMRKLAIQNEIQKRRKEAEAKKQKIDEQKYISDRKIETVTSEYSQETINWPDDLGELVNKWGSYPENQNNNSFFKTITNTEMDQLKRTALEPILPQQHQQQPVTHNNQVLRGWSIHRPSPMVARPLISQINNRAILNRTVVPRPILTHPVSTAGRPLMSHIVAGRHHIMSQFVTGRPIISRVISGHSLMGNTVTAQSLMNHSSIAGRNIIQGIQNNSNANSSQVLQNHNLSRQLNHNVTFFSYNSTLQSRNEHQIITKKIVDE